MKITIIGSGVAGSVLSNLLSKLGHKVTVLEKEKCPGGMCKSYYKDGFVYEYGPHILAVHNSSDEAIDYLRSNVETIDTQMTTASFINGVLTNYPPGIHSVGELGLEDIVKDELESRPVRPDETNFETYLVDKVGETLYQMYFKNFTKKFWGVEPDMLSADWAKIRRLGEKVDAKKMFFNEKWCGYPIKDWNVLFDTLLRDIDVIYDCEVVGVDFYNNRIQVDGDQIEYDFLISTMPVEQLFGYKKGKLQYAGYRIEPVVLDRKSYIELDGEPVSMTYFPDNKEQYTRVTDYGAFQKKHRFPYHKKTIVTFEYPDHSIRLYPFSDGKNLVLFEEYIKEAASTDNVITFGRLGLYKYLTSDTTVDMAFRLIKHIENWIAMNPVERLKAYKEIRGEWDN
ncbi:MAG: UDP-galactopyranose mutase [Candidatus Scalindua sp.]